jgi:hypothetical protein
VTIRPIDGSRTIPEGELWMAWPIGDKISANEAVRKCKAKFGSVPSGGVVSGLGYIYAGPVTTEMAQHYLDSLRKTEEDNNATAVA